MGEAELRRAKEEWERTFDAVPDLISIIDDRHRIVRANRAMAERLALTPRQCVGKLCYEAVHGTTCPPETCPHRLTLSDGSEHVAEFHDERLGGDFLVTTTPLTDEAGRRALARCMWLGTSRGKSKTQRLCGERAMNSKCAADLQAANEQLQCESATRQQRTDDQSAPWPSHAKDGGGLGCRTGPGGSKARRAQNVSPAHREHMPGMSGIELQERLAKLGICPPIIFVTAYDTPQTREHAREAASFGLLLKPFDKQDLLNAVAEAVRHTCPRVVASQVQTDVRR